MAHHPTQRKFLLWLVSAIGTSATLAPISSGLARAGVVEGVVRNGTTSSPQPHQAVVLLKLEGGMQPVATVPSDSRGHFRVENVDSSSASPYLLQVTYAGANYFQSVVFGGRHRVEAEVTVYEASAKPGDISVDGRAVRLQPSAAGEQGTRLNVEESYEISNQSEPPATLYQGEGTFRFYVSSGRLSEPRVSVESPAGMPVTRAAIPLREADAFGVDYPLKPGRTRIRIAYELNYGGGQASFASKSYYPVKSLLVLAPRTGVEIAGARLRAEGEDEESGLRIYSAGAHRAGELLQVQIKGLGEGSAASAAEDGTAAAVRRMPNAVSQARWYILGFALFILGVALVHLYRIDQAPPADSRAKGQAPPRAGSGIA